MTFAAALSEHPVTAYATGEVCGQVLEAIDARPDLALVFTTLAHAGALEDVAAAVEEVLHPSVLVGAASTTLIGPGREVEGGAGIALWAGRLGPVAPVRIQPVADPSGFSFAGLPGEMPFQPSALLLIGDPYSVPVGDLLEEIATTHPGLPVVGGMAAGAQGSGGTRMVAGGRIFTDGAVGALIGPGTDVTPVVSQGCRPIGRPYVVTDGTGTIIRELGGKPALRRLEEIATSLGPEEIRAINRGGLHIGRVVDESKLDFSTGDFLVRQVMGGDQESGAIAVNDEVTIGTTVQFHLRDAEAAHDDLEALVARVSATAAPDAALLFSCTGRGRALFGVPDHDAGVLEECLGHVPTAGFFAAGELGPVAGANHMHSFSASMLLLSDRR